MSPSDPQEKKSKWRTLGLGGHAKEPTKPDPTNRNSASDSTYGSEPSNSTNNVPSLAGSDASRNTQNQPQTNDRGETVTTTTTTTTTTTSGGGQQSTTRHDPGQTTVNGEDGGPPIPIKSSMRERSPNPGTGQNSRRDRSPNPTSPTNSRSNFSYPSRTPPPQGYPAPGPGQQNVPPGQQAMAQEQQNVLRGQQETMQRQQGTLQGLKTAAVGIHGAGETLRGTVNSAVDRRFKAPPEQIAAHNQVAQAGREEIESGRMSETTRQRERFNHIGSSGQPGSGVDPAAQQQGKKGILRNMRDSSGQLRVVNE